MCVSLCILLLYFCTTFVLLLNCCSKKKKDKSTEDSKKAAKTKPKEEPPAAPDDKKLTTAVTIEEKESQLKTAQSRMHPNPTGAASQLGPMPSVLLSQRRELAKKPQNIATAPTVASQMGTVSSVLQAKKDVAADQQTASRETPIPSVLLTETRGKRPAPSAQNSGQPQQTKTDATAVTERGSSQEKKSKKRQQKGSVTSHKDVSPSSSDEVIPPEAIITLCTTEKSFHEKTKDKTVEGTAKLEPQKSTVSEEFTQSRKGVASLIYANPQQKKTPRASSQKSTLTAGTSTSQRSAMTAATSTSQRSAFTAATSTSQRSALIDNPQAEKGNSEQMMRTATSQRKKT